MGILIEKSTSESEIFTGIPAQAGVGFVAFYVVGGPFWGVTFTGIDPSSIPYIIKCRLCCFFSIVVIGIFDIGIKGIGKMAVQHDIGHFLGNRLTDGSIPALIEQIGPVTETTSVVEFSTNIGMAVKLCAAIITKR